MGKVAVIQCVTIGRLHAENVDVTTDCDGKVLNRQLRRLALSTALDVEDG